ncbi:hypothetical protein [Polyangium sp. 6x1]|uniref:hypothetical protein n=1 Tax=Polyangium sp. 6x1 TaxID=3042689 RepID=UPI002482790B|nr:hypothetical protein [Polyangium sp. 6x1]MDI1450347.1 hypothetical protein [Polyangium sp. 6x1]
MRAPFWRHATLGASALLSLCATGCHLVAGLEEREVAGYGGVGGQTCDPVHGKPGPDLGPALMVGQIPIVEETERPRHLAVDSLADGYVYWSSEAAGTLGGVWRAPKFPENLVTKGVQVAPVDASLRTIGQLLVDGTNSYVYWVERPVGECTPDNPLRIMRIAPGETCAVGEQLFASCEAGVNQIALDGAALYWTDPPAHKVWSMDVVTKEMTDTQLAADVEPVAIGVDTEAVFWSARVGAAGEHRFFRMAKKTKEIQEAPAEHLAQIFALHDEYVYWISPDFGVAGRFTANDISNQNPFLEGIDKPGDIAFRGDRVYVSAAAEAMVRIFTRDMLEPLNPLATVQAYPQGMGLVGDYLFWANFQGNVIMRHQF